MDAVIRAAAVYAILLILVRISGRRTLSEMTAFDFVLLLIIGEATQQALLGEDFSITNAILVITTLLLMDIIVSLVKVRSRKIGKLVDGVPTVIVENGCVLHERMRQARLNEDDVMEAARRLQGIERMDQIKYAVIEVSGGITVIPQRQVGA